MNRRNFVTAAASAGLAARPASAAGTNAIFEMRYFHMRSGNQLQRTTDYLEKYVAPASKRLGIGPCGFFSALIAEQSPFILCLTSYPSYQAAGEAADRMMSDKEFQKGFEEYNSMSDLSYIRMESALLRAFDGWPSLTVPPARKNARIFEIRTYESNNAKAAQTKIRMFNEAESGIFKRLGFEPVFFGETVVGRNLPNLTYMVSFADLADREQKFKAFSADSEWQKLRARPEYPDALVVSNISNAIVRPLAFSQIS